MLEKISIRNKYLRKAIFKVYGEKCFYCDELVTDRNMQIDHILASEFTYSDDSDFQTYLSELVDQGFDLKQPNHIENYALCCGHCNQSKRNRNFDVNNMRYFHQQAKDKAPKVRELMEQYKAKPPKDIDLFKITIEDDKPYFAKKFTELLFLHTDEEPLCLRDTYIFPRCGDKLVNDVLAKYLSQKAKRGDPLEQLLFIEGLPAVGKSSLVSWLAWNYENKTDEAEEILGDRTLYVIRLRDLEAEHVSMDNPLIGLFQYMSKERGITAEDKKELEAIYGEIGEKLDHSVLVLDGFDELCMVDKMKESDSEVYFVKLYNELFNLRKNCKVIVTSRPRYIELTGMNVPPEARENITIEPFSADDRRRWVERYERKYPINSRLRETLITEQNENIEGLLQIPLAVYMAASRDKPIDSDANVWELYHNMFHDEAYSRQYSDREAHPMNKVYDSDDLYTLTSEIAWELYQSGRLYMTGEQLMERGALRQLIEKLANKYSEDQRELLEKCVGISSYFSMRKENDSYAIEFCHNNIQDFFCCEKLYRDINEIYNRSDSKEDKINILIALYISLFKRRELNKTTCFFLSERAKHDVHKKIYDFPLKEKRELLLPTLYQKMLVEGMIYNNLQVNNYMQTIERILYGTAQVYRYAYVPLVGEDEHIEWWDDVRAVNDSGMLRYLCRILRDVIGFKADLQGAALSGTDLRHGNLRGAKLCCAELVLADLFGAILSGTDLSGAVLVGAILRNEDLSGADLHNVKLSGADLCFVKFINADLRGADLHNSYLQFAELINADLSGADLRYAHMCFADFTKVNLCGADLSKSDLQHAGLRFADLSKADLVGTNLNGADLNGACLYAAMLSNSTLPDGYRSDSQDEQLTHIITMRDEEKDVRFKDIII